MIIPERLLLSLSFSVFAYFALSEHSMNVLAQVAPIEIEVCVKRVVTKDSQILDEMSHYFRALPSSRVEMIARSKDDEGREVLLLKWNKRVINRFANDESELSFSIEDVIQNALNLATAKTGEPAEVLLGQDLCRKESYTR